MKYYFLSDEKDQSITQVDEIAPRSWLRFERPNEAEKAELIELGLDADIVHDALDPHEVPRVEVEDGWVYFITRLPDTDDDFNDFTTPILFALGQDMTITVSRDSLGRLWQPFIDKTQVDTANQAILFVLMVDAIAMQYQRRVAAINRQMRAATSDVRKLRSKDIVTLTDYERKLNDYLDALIPTSTAVKKLLGGRLLKFDDDATDVVEDTSIDLEQLIARCKSLLRTITNVRDSYRAVMDTRLNETIRLLTVITLTLTIPTMLAGLYGMNVPLPWSESSYVFWAVIGMSVVAGAVLSLFFLRQR